MKEIKHFLLPEHFNKVYQYEASSSLNLTREVADKINELVDAYNNFSKTDLQFKQTVEGAVRKAILYMKDNLVNTIYDLFKLYGYDDEEKIKELMTQAMLDNDKYLLEVTSGFVNLKQYGAVGDGLHDDTKALKEALKENVSVYIPDGTYKITEQIKLDEGQSLKGQNRNKTILKFSDGLKGLQLNHSNTVENLTVSFNGDGAGLYVYTPDNSNYALSSVVRNVRINHESDDIKGTGILLVAEKVDKLPNGAYNLKFEDIDIRNNVQYGIQILNNARTTSASECWFTDIKFTNVFINSCETAINIDWVNLSGNVPKTGTAPKNDGIYFTNVNAQYVEGVTKKFARIMNALNVRFDNCFSFDYWHLYPENVRIYTFNALSNMCRVDLGNCPEVSDIYKNYLERYIEFINSSGDFMTDMKTVVRYIMLSTGSIYGNFINYDKSYDNFNFGPMPLSVDVNIDTMWNTHQHLLNNGAIQYTVQAPSGELVIGRETETSGIQLFLSSSVSDAPVPVIYARMRFVAGEWRDKYKVSFVEA